MATQIDYTQQLIRYKKKRNLFLFFIIVPFLGVILIYSLNLGFNVISQNIMDTLLLVSIIFYLLYVSYFKSKLSLVSMYYEYYLLLSSQIDVLTLKQPVTINHIHTRLKSLGYVLKQSFQSFDIYLLNQKPNNHFFSRKGSVVLITIIKDELDLYDASIQNSMESIYQELEKKKNPINHQFNIMVKWYETIDNESKEELQKIVNVKQGNYSLVQINVGLSNINNDIYFLSPKKRYPNRLYFETINEIKSIFRLQGGQ